MTLILTVNGQDSIWLLADRRLSLVDRSPRDDARKVLFLQTNDGVAFLGYAGLGATALGTEPTDWMSAVLRGRNVPQEQSLSILAEALKKQFPRHMLKMPGNDGPVHNVVVTAFLGTDVRLYSIDLFFTPDRMKYSFRFTRHVTSISPNGWTPRLGIAGSGSIVLMHEKRWIRPLLRLSKAYDHGRISAYALADHLAKLNNDVHMQCDTVGPRCIVAWRNIKGGSQKGNSGHQFYSGIMRDRNSPSLPTIAYGMDVTALVKVLMPHFTKQAEKTLKGQAAPEVNEGELNAELARLPDEDLR